MIQPRPSRGPKAVKMDRATLLAAAQKVFARDGLEAASLRAIAKEAGCDPSLIYYYFENKEAMFTALLDERIPAFVKALRKVANPRDPRSTAEKIWTIQQLFRAHANDKGFRAMVRGQITRGAEGIQPIIEARLIPAQVAMRAVFRRGIRRGELRPGQDPLLLTLFLLRLEAEILDLVPAFSQRVAGLAPEKGLAKAERAWFDVFWRGIAADPDAPLAFLPPQP